MKKMTEAAVRDSAGERNDSIGRLNFAHAGCSDETDCLPYHDLPPRHLRCCECLHSRPDILLTLFCDQGVFGMNVSEINPEGTATLPHYIAVALPLTVFTAWVIVAFQSRYIFPDHAPFWHRLAWPFVILWRWMRGEQITFPTKKGVNGYEEATDIPMQSLGHDAEDEDHTSDVGSIKIDVEAASPAHDLPFNARRSHSFTFSQTGSSQAH
jgi:hypothetical protein